MYSFSRDNMAVDKSGKRVLRCCSQQEGHQQDHSDPGISDLPDDILLLCLQGLGAADLASASCVCKQWQRITNEEGLWKKQCITAFGANYKQLNDTGAHSWKKLYEIKHLNAKFGR